MNEKKEGGCRWCGRSDPRCDSDDEGAVYWITCLKCRAESPPRESRAEAWDLWNEPRPTACPEMFEALKAMSERFLATHPKDVAIIEAARAALAKAGAT